MPLLFWIMDGVFAGWLTGKVMRSEGHEKVMDVVMGVAGAVGGGFLISVAPFLVQGKMIYTNVSAILGAVALIVVSRYAGGRRAYSSTN